MKLVNVSVSSVKATLVFFMAAIMFLLSGFHSTAQDSAHNVKFKNGSFTYLGMVDEEVIIGLLLDNQRSKKIAITIMNDSGDRIFHQIFNGKKIARNFKIPAEMGTLIFIVDDSGEKDPHQFKIHTERRYVDEVLVTKG